MAPSDLHIAVVGAGIGGLACAIACRQQNPPIRVTILERAPEILTIGAGIHIPPNGTKVLHHLGLYDKLMAAGAYEVGSFVLRRYDDGKVIVVKSLGDRMVRDYGAEWIAIHRGDYQQVLVEEAIARGVEILLDADVTNVEQAQGEAASQLVFLKDGRQIRADAVIGADGLWSTMRDHVLGHPHAPNETGDLAYRGTFSREQLTALNDPTIDEMMKAPDVQDWMGPDAHGVFYPLRNYNEYNLVIIARDNLPKGIRTAAGTVEEMLESFQGFDQVYVKLISCLKTALKWKLLHFERLSKWTRGCVALLGDASHPTLPYLGQGAAMAVEDGAVIGLLLGSLQEKGLSTDANKRASQLANMFELYEDLRKTRTETIVQGSAATRDFYHLPDGPEQEQRDKELAQLPESEWKGRSNYHWGDAAYQKRMLGFDVLADARQEFETWYSKQKPEAHL